MASVTFCPRGIYIVTSSEDCTAKLWMAKTGRYVKSYHGHTDEVQGATFSECGAWIVTAGLDNIARVWSIDETRCY